MVSGRNTPFASPRKEIFSTPPGCGGDHQTWELGPRTSMDLTSQFLCLPDTETVTCLYLLYDFILRVPDWFYHVSLYSLNAHSVFQDIVLLPSAQGQYGTKLIFPSSRQPCLDPRVPLLFFKIHFIIEMFEHKNKMVSEPPCTHHPDPTTINMCHYFISLLPHILFLHVSWSI